MNNHTNPSKAKRNYYVDIASLLPFLLLLFTGIIMLQYHAGKPVSENTLGKGSNFWLNIHIVLAIISLVIISLHLVLHMDWFKKLFTGKLKNKYRIRNLILVIVFLSTAITSFVPWILFEGSNMAIIMLGLHNKLGLLLIVFFVVHLLSYFRWLIKMTIKVFNSNSCSNRSS